MLDPNAVVYSIGVLEDLIQKPIPNPTDAQKKMTLAHLKTVEQGFNDLRAQVYKQTQDAITASDEGLTTRRTLSHVSLDWRGDPQDTETFGRAFVRFIGPDGEQSEPGSAFQNGAEPCFQMWPIPKTYTFTLSNLKALVTLLEENAKRLPYEDA